MNDLKPCPFCGKSELEFDGKATILHGSFEWIRCKNCSAQGSAYLNSNPLEKSIADIHWNTRPIEDDLRRQRDGEIVIEDMLKHDIELQKQMIITIRAERDALRKRLVEYNNETIELRKERDLLRAQLDMAKETVQKIDDWARAYPLDIFPEPDWAKVKELLGSDLLSAVSASNMRHVISGVKSLVDEALRQLEEK